MRRMGSFYCRFCAKFRWRQTFFGHFRACKQAKFKHSFSVCANSLVETWSLVKTRLKCKIGWEQ